MSDKRKLTYNRFEQILREWDKYIEIIVPHISGGHEIRKITDYAPEIWESITSDSPDIHDLFERAFARIQIEQFKELYERQTWPEPEEAFARLNQYAQEIVLRENLYDELVKKYKRVREAKRKNCESRKRIPNETGTVYVIRSKYGCKIGSTKNIKSRRQLFAVKLPFSWELVYQAECENYRDIERELHQHFADKRLNGEWFDLDETDIEYIKSYTANRFIDDAK